MDKIPSKDCSRVNDFINLPGFVSRRLPLNEHDPDGKLDGLNSFWCLHRV